MGYNAITGGYDNTVDDIISIIRTRVKCIPELISEMWDDMNWLVANAIKRKRIKNETYIEKFKLFYDMSDPVYVDAPEDIKLVKDRFDLILEITDAYFDTDSNKQEKFIQDIHDLRKDGFTKTFKEIYYMALKNRGKSLSEIQKDSDNIKDAKAREQYIKNIGKLTPKYNKKNILDNLSINLLWINDKLDDKLDDNQQYLFPSTWNRMGENIDIIKRIRLWSDNYKIVNIWYDSKSKYVSKLDDIITNTNKLLSDIGNKINLIDIQTVPIIRENYDIIKNVGLYFIVDWVKVCITDYYLDGKPDGTFFLYADVSYNPMDVSPDILLSPVNVYLLNKYGIMVAANSYFENSFHVVGNHNKNLTRVFRNILVKYSLQQLEYMKTTYSQDSIPGHTSQMLFNLYPLMFIIFYDLENLQEYYEQGDSKKRVNEIYLDDPPNKGLYDYYMNIRHGEIKDEQFRTDLNHKIIHILSNILASRIPMIAHTTIIAPVSHFD
jgi:hypothetical protein